MHPAALTQHRPGFSPLRGLGEQAWGSEVGPTDRRCRRKGYVL